MISKECAKIGDINRKRYDAGSRKPDYFLPYPEGCECACGHELIQEWEKMFKPGIIPPWRKKLEENPVL